MTEIIAFVLGIAFGMFVLKRDFTLNVNKNIYSEEKQPEPLTDAEINTLLSMEEKRSHTTSGSAQEDLNKDGLYEAIAAITAGTMDIEDLL